LRIKVISSQPIWVYKRLPNSSEERREKNLFKSISLFFAIPKDKIKKFNAKLKHIKMAFEFTDSNFSETALGKETVAVVDFWAAWCGPCRMIAPVIEELAVDYKDRVVVGKVDVDANPETAMKYGVRSIPTILILKNGEVVDKQVGVTTKNALAEKIEAQL